MSSSDASSFDAAVPAEASNSDMQSPDGSHPSSAGTYKNVTSVPPSETAKRSRQAIEDAERERRPTGRVKRDASSSRPT